MKKLAFALVAVAATFTTGSAFAADLRPAVKAPPPAPVAVANWTGCYISGGGGYGLWKQENTDYLDGPPRVRITDTYTAGGDGWFGTVGGGCDYQFGGIGPWQIVIGAFADYDFADMDGTRVAPSIGFLGGSVGNEKLTDQWAVGGRIGVLVTPQLLTYVSGGYTEAKFDRTNYTSLFGPPFVAAGVFSGSHTYSGWFIGSGYEYQLSFLPGLFWKTEYRFSQFDTDTVAFRDVATGLPIGVSSDQEKWVHTVRSQLVWRFNWGGPVVARY
jgi:outer membrane immunogenic protein